MDVADNATSSAGGLPPAALEADHPDDFDAWDLMASFAEGSSELEGRVEQAASTFQPAPSSANVPAGFPEEFPVHPDATLVESGLDEDGSVTATWQVEATFGTVADFYLESLQEGRHRQGHPGCTGVS